VQVEAETASANLEQAKIREEEVLEAYRTKKDQANALRAEAQRKASEARKADDAAKDAESEVAKLKDYAAKAERDTQEASMEAARCAKDAAVAKQEAQKLRSATNKLMIEDDEL